LFYVVHHLFVLVVIFGVVHDTALLWVMLPGLSLYVCDKVRQKRETATAAATARCIRPAAACALKGVCVI
jgi:hypothetical protein